MAKIIGFQTSTNKEGKSFVSFKLQGGVEALQSQQTGRLYLTAKTCLIPSTFDESVAQSLVGTDLPGTVERVVCPPYDYTVRSTGEVITLMHRYEYIPEGHQAMSAVLSGQEDTPEEALLLS